MPSSPIIFQDAEKFEDSYNRKFGKSFNIDFSELKDNVKQILNNKKFIYVYLITLSAVLFAMYKFKPQFVMKKKLNYDTGAYEYVVNNSDLVMYSVLASIFVVIGVVIVINKYSEEFFEA